MTTDETITRRLSFADGWSAEWYAGGWRLRHPDGRVTAPRATIEAGLRARDASHFVDEDAPKAYEHVCPPTESDSLNYCKICHLPIVVIREEGRRIALAYDTRRVVGETEYAHEHWHLGRS